MRQHEIHERLGDRRAILRTCANPGLVYGDARGFARAIDCSRRVRDLATRFTVEPETVAATHLNLGAACLRQGKHDSAFEHCPQALAIAEQARLRVLRQGSIKRSGCAALCGVGGATASMQPVQLTGREPLLHACKGPGTRCRLAA